MSKDKRLRSFYANIDWEKAKDLFKQQNVIRKEGKLFPSTEEILHILAAAGTIGLTFAFPHAGATLGSLLLGEKSYSGWRTAQIITQLKKQKYISIIENHDGSTTVKITKNGMVRALTYKLNSMSLNRPKRWDKKWRIVIFDIPNKYRRIRDIFRMRLLQLNLYQLQESVYVSPYPCFNEVEFLRELYGVSFTVRYLLVDKIEDDDFIRHYFNI